MTASCTLGNSQPACARTARCSSTPNTRRRSCREACRRESQSARRRKRPAAFPLAWATDPFQAALIGSFVKVLIRFRPDDDELIREAQWDKLKALHAWCRHAAKPLVIEVLVARRHEPEDAFESIGRPSIVARFIDDAYRRHVVPQFWKIEGTASREGARTIDEAIARHPDPRQILLGKAADLRTIDAWFAAAAASATAVGFAIGRSVFWNPSTAFLSGTIDRVDAARDIAATYLQLVDGWNRAKGVADSR